MLEDLKHLEKNLDVMSVLMALNWLKLYDTEHVLAGRWGLGEDTIRNRVRKYLTLIESLVDKKIVWTDFKDEEIYLVSVDGVHCKIQEPRKDPGSHWYSHKSNGAGVSYEVAVAIRRNNLACVRGPFPASTHDVTIFRGGKKNDPSKDPNALQFKIPEGKRAVGDSGYRGEPKKVSVTRTNDSRNVQIVVAQTSM
jgi:hypothetical protein